MPVRFFVGIIYNVKKISDLIFPMSPREICFSKTRWGIFIHRSYVGEEKMVTLVN
jgi:hypothetical protein